MTINREEIVFSLSITKAMASVFLTLGWLFFPRNDLNVYVNTIFSSSVTLPIYAFISMMSSRTPTIYHFLVVTC